MSHSRSLLALIALGSLAGCAADYDAEFNDENLGTAEQAVVYPTGTVYNTGGDAINVRSGPNTESSIVGTVSEGMSLGISCQVNGTSVLGTTIWNFVPSSSGYVSNAYVLTGYDGFVPGMPICSVSPPPSPSALGAAIVAKGRTYIGYEPSSGDCSKFSTAPGNPCPAWSGDFARYVWGQAGANTSGLTSSLGSFRDYGISRGTWKSASTIPKVGDAVIWGDPNNYARVAIISAVSGSTFRILHGDYDNNGNGRGEVYETGYVNNTNTALTAKSIAGFASPMP